MSSLALRVRSAWSTLTGAAPLAFDAAGRGSRLVQWNPPAAAFGSLRLPLPVLARARDSYRNNPWARRAVEATVAGAVSTGIKPLVESARKRQAHELFLRWTDQCDFEQRRDFFGFEADVLRNLLIDGEALVLLSPSGRSGISTRVVENGVPLELQLLAPEFLDTSRVDDRTSDGIEYDAEGRRAAYWLYSRHPADVPDMISRRFPADRVLHVYWPLSPGTPRGISWLTPALTSLHELQGYVESERVRARTASLFCGFVMSPDGSNPLLNSEGELAMEPGSMSRLKPGEEIKFSEPPATSNFESFVRTQLRAIASALSIPYELLANDVSQITFASGRHALLAWRRWLETLTHHVIVYQFCRPVWETWTRFALMAGVLEGALEDYQRVRWIAPPTEMLDARQEVQSVVARVRGGFISRSEAVAQSGLDAEQLEAEIAVENRRADALGLVFDSDARRTSAQGQQQPIGVTDAVT